MLFNIPNSLTWARIALIPFFVGIYYLPESVVTLEEKNLVATLTFIVAAVTDWFDGYLARYLRQTSAFGAFLDPVADKLMVAAALIVLVHLGRVDSLIALVIIGREITISALREWMAKVGASGSVAVAFVGLVGAGAVLDVATSSAVIVSRPAIPSAPGLGSSTRILPSFLTSSKVRAWAPSTAHSATAEATNLRNFIVCPVGVFRYKKIRPADSGAGAWENGVARGMSGHGVIKLLQL